MAGAEEIATVCHATGHRQQTQCEGLTHYMAAHVVCIAIII